jgi:hypothetical protein
MGPVPVFRDIISWGKDDFSNNPNPTKELTAAQRELFIRWIGDEKFFRGTITGSEQNTIRTVMTENKYDNHQKWKLAQIRERWISYLKKYPL